MDTSAETLTLNHVDSLCQPTMTAGCVGKTQLRFSTIVLKQRIQIYARHYIDLSCVYTKKLKGFRVGGCH